MIIFLNKIMRTKNKTIRLFLLFFLGVTIPITINAQQLVQPQKNCEGAKVIPEDLKSWCDPKYYNKCECEFEKAMEEYRKQKKYYEDQLQKYNSEKDQKLREIRSIVEQGNQATTKLFREEDASHQALALSKYNEAIREYGSLKVIFENISNVGRVLGNNPNSMYDPSKYVDQDLSNVKKRYQDVLTWQPKPKGADITLSDDLDDLLSGKQSKPQESNNELDDFLSGKKTNPQGSNNDLDAFLGGEPSALNDTSYQNDLDAILSGEITETDRFDYNIEYKDGMHGVVNENGKVLIPFRNWRIVKYDPDLGVAHIHENYQKMERDSYKNGGESGTAKVDTYLLSIVNANGDYIIEKEKHAKVYAGRTQYLTLFTSQKITGGRTKGQVDAEKRAVDSWAKIKESELVRKYESQGYIIHLGQFY